MATLNILTYMSQKLIAIDALGKQIDLNVLSMKSTEQRVSCSLTQRRQHHALLLPWHIQPERDYSAIPRIHRATIHGIELKLLSLT